MFGQVDWQMFCTVTTKILIIFGLEVARNKMTQEWVIMENCLFIYLENYFFESDVNGLGLFSKTSLLLESLKLRVRLSEIQDNRGCTKWAVERKKMCECLLL